MQSASLNDCDGTFTAPPATLFPPGEASACLMQRELQSTIAMKETVLLTGCTSGIGLHLAHQFASNAHPLILVAPGEAELQTLASVLTSRYNARVRWIAKDLEMGNAAEEIHDELQADGVQVDILANNAGHGFHGNTWEIPIETHLSIIRLNVEAVVRLTNLFLPPMVARGSGRIFITASVAGFEAGPTVNVYHASKAFVLSYAEGLSVELEKTGVSVTALCPGATDTDFFPKANMEGVVGFHGPQGRRRSWLQGTHGPRSHRHSGRDE
jgi:short-subunit dehydrogenase